MRKYLALLLTALLFSVLAGAQTHQDTRPWEKPVGGPYRSTYTANATYERLIDSRDVEANVADGSDATVGFCFKAITSGGTEWSACGSGIAASSGSADPSGGTADDVYFQVDGSDVLQSVWRNIAGTWTEFTVPSGMGGGTGASITSGTADPTGGAAGDAYIQVDASDVVQSLWRNVSGTWTEFTLPAGGSGVSLSDDSPENIAAAGNSGTSVDGSRSDHVHDAFSTATPANLGVTAVAGIGAFASRSDHVHRGLSDTDPADVGTTAPGTRPFASRDDHVHAGVGQTYRGNWIATGFTPGAI